MCVSVTTEFESLSVKLEACRPSVEINRRRLCLQTAWTSLELFDCKFVVVGDFNVPGDNVEQLNSHVVDLFSLYNLYQLVSVPIHVSGNVLDLMLLQDDDDSSSIYAVGLPADLSPR